MQIINKDDFSQYGGIYIKTTIWTKEKFTK